MLQLRHYNPLWLSRLPIAHRGLHDADMPENSLAAFRAAADAGYGIELDIRTTGDGKLAVIHDANTLRMTGCDLIVAKAASAELAKLRLGPSDETIPLLDEVLALVGGRVPLMIEVKSGGNVSDVIAKLDRALAGYNGEVAVASFDPRILLAISRHMPLVPRVQIAGRIPEHRYPSALKWMLRMMPLNFWTKPTAIAYDKEDIPAATLEWWSIKLGAYVIEWTVKSLEDEQRAASLGHNVAFEVIRPQILPR